MSVEECLAPKPHLRHAPYPPYEPHPPYAPDPPYGSSHLHHDEGEIVVLLRVLDPVFHFG